MRILFNRLTALRQKTGIGHHAAQLLAALSEQQGEDVISLYPGAISAGMMRALRAFRLRRPGGGSRDSKLGLLLHRLARTFSAWHFRVSNSLTPIDLYHEPNAIAMPAPWPTVATIHDLSVLLHPQWHPADRVAYYERHLPASAARCRHLLTVSEFTRREVIRHLGVPPERVSVAYNGVDAAMKPLPAGEVQIVRTRLGLPPEYLLHVGTLEPRKNLMMLVKAFAALPAAIRERCPLVLAGGWGWNVGPLRDYLNVEGKQLSVLRLGYVEDRHLPALYNGARALVFPSHYEGFGLPPLEMLACGGAVLASTAGAVVEVVGKNAALIDAEDEVGWSDALGRVIVDDDWRNALRQGATARARLFTWQRCAAATWEVYRGVLEKRRAAA